MALHRFVWSFRCRCFNAFTPKVMDIFQLVYLEPINYLYVLLISLVPLVLVEIQKLIKDCI